MQVSVLYKKCRSGAPAQKRKLQRGRVLHWTWTAPLPALLDNLIERGLDAKGCYLFIVDGAKALSKAIRRTFGADIPVQRCQIHKARNITDRFAPTPSLTCLQSRLIKIGARFVRHAGAITFRLAEVAVPRNLFGQILASIRNLKPPRGPRGNRQHKVTQRRLGSFVWARQRQANPRAKTSPSPSTRAFRTEIRAQP